MPHDIADGFRRGDFKLPLSLAELVASGELVVGAGSLADMAAPARAVLDWLPDVQGLLDRLRQPLTTSDFETLLSEARTRTQAIAHDTNEDETVRDAARSTNAIVALTERVVRLERLFTQVLPEVRTEVETMHGAVVDGLDSINRAKQSANVQSQLNTVWRGLVDGADALGLSEKLTSGALPFTNAGFVDLCMARDLLQKTDDGGDYSDAKNLGVHVTKFFNGKEMYFAKGAPTSETKKLDFLNVCWAAYVEQQKAPVSAPIQLRKAL